jgi:hypothetical protein
MRYEAVTSSALAAVGYEPRSRTLGVVFRSGGIYEYAGVPRGVYDELMSAPSKGRYFAACVRDRYPATRVR